MRQGIGCVCCAIQDNVDKANAEPLLAECEELVRMLTASVKSLQQEDGS